MRFVSHRSPNFRTFPDARISPKLYLADGILLKKKKNDKKDKKGKGRLVKKILSYGTLQCLFNRSQLMQTNFNDRRLVVNVFLTESMRNGKYMQFRSVYLCSHPNGIPYAYGFSNQSLSFSRRMLLEVVASREISLSLEHSQVGALYLEVRKSDIRAMLAGGWGKRSSKIRPLSPSGPSGGKNR